MRIIELGSVIHEYVSLARQEINWSYYLNYGSSEKIVAYIYEPLCNFTCLKLKGKLFAFDSKKSTSSKLVLDFECQRSSKFTSGAYVSYDDLQPKDLDFPIISSKNKSRENHISGFLNVKTGVITMLWPFNPGDHFLTISYEYGIIENNSDYWKLEGF